MCFERDSAPPIAPILGAEVRYRELVLEAGDGNRFSAYHAMADIPGAASVVILPDVRGLFDFYRNLAIRFAEAGHDAVAIDYFGRTAGLAPRDEEFPFIDHAAETTIGGITADVSAAIAHLRAEHPEGDVFTVGFCFGGSNSWHQATAGHGLAGAVGFYGNPRGTRPADAPHIIDVVSSIECPILALMGGNDPGIPPGVIDEFDAALSAAGVEHQVVTYPGAPHSFFDRRHEEFAAESEDAWERVLGFMATHG